MVRFEICFVSSVQDFDNETYFSFRDRALSIQFVHATLPPRAVRVSIAKVDSKIDQIDLEIIEITEKINTASSDKVHDQLVNFRELLFADKAQLLRKQEQLLNKEAHYFSQQAKYADVLLAMERMSLENRSSSSGTDECGPHFV